MYSILYFPTPNFMDKKWQNLYKGRNAVVGVFCWTEMQNENRRFLGRKLITHTSTWNVIKIDQCEIQTEILLFGVFKMSP